jgi:hypothetical protein
VLQEVLNDLPEADMKAKEVGRHRVSGIQYAYGFSSKVQFAHCHVTHSTQPAAGGKAVTHRLRNIASCEKKTTLQGTEPAVTPRPEPRNQISQIPQRAQKGGHILDGWMD